MCKSKPRHSPSKDGLKLLSFNIEGLASGLEDPSFIDLMYKHISVYFAKRGRRMTRKKIFLGGGISHWLDQRIRRQEDTWAAFLFCAKRSTGLG